MVTLNCAHNEKRTAGTTTNGEKGATPRRVFEAQKPIPDTLTAKNLFGGGMYEFTTSFSEEARLHEAMEADRQRERYAKLVGRCPNQTNQNTGNACSSQ
jgi:hypothetical protein